MDFDTVMNWVILEIYCIREDVLRI